MSRWIVHQLTNSRWFDISAARRDLGYEPRVSLEDGMRRLKAWIEEQEREPGG
jgi:nucleoside-diphosphate-sugar epimerase